MVCKVAILTQLRLQLKRGRIQAGRRGLLHLASIRHPQHSVVLINSLVVFIWHIEDDENRYMQLY